MFRNLTKNYLKTFNCEFVFRKLTLLVEISNIKCVGKELYEKGSMTKMRIVRILEKHIFSKYKDHLIILNNTRSYNN